MPDAHVLTEDRFRPKAPPVDRDPFDANGMGLCLSGGGYKAAAYHLGALLRLNEMGALRLVKRIASVSGGSIPAAYLGLKWSTLDWDGNVAKNFYDAAVKPVRAFLTSVNVDTGAIVAGLLLPGRSGADGVESAYRKHLFGNATLQHLPDEPGAPRFVILATNYQLNSLWRFSKPYSSDYRVGMIAAAPFPLAKVVTASSGFPPVFCPVAVDFAGMQVQPWPDSDRCVAPYNQRALLADAGIFDNMGLEPIWKRYGILLVSNAGDPIDERPEPPGNWIGLLRRTMSMMHRQAENNRQRWLMEMATRKERKVAYWPMRSYIREYPTRGPGLSDDEAERAMAQKVRLAALKPAEFLRLYQHGYSLTDAAMRSYLGYANAPPASLPA